MTDIPGALPSWLEEAAARAADGFGAAIGRAADDLSRRYRDEQKPYFFTAAHRAAYLRARLPATYAALQTALAALPQFNLPVTSLLDLGAGPGTALWAAAETFPGLRRATLVECDGGMREIGRELARAAPFANAIETQWLAEDFTRLREPLPHDAVTLAYALGEIPPDAAARLVLYAWESAAHALLLLEPGTPAGFARLRAARELLLTQTTAKALMPCPHNRPCPMSGSDWCHFLARLPRTAAHKKLKHATLAYEDEKFSYLLLGREERTDAPARVLRHPRKHKGHVILQICAPDGIRRLTVSRRGKDGFKRARQAKWGDAWEDTAAEAP